MHSPGPALLLRPASNTSEVKEKSQSVLLGVIFQGPFLLNSRLLCVYGMRKAGVSCHFLNGNRGACDPCRRSLLPSHLLVD